MDRLACVEGEAFSVDRELKEQIYDALIQARSALRFRSWPMTDRADGKVMISGIVGLVQLKSGMVLEILPKTRPEDNWINALLSLITKSNRIDIVAERRGGSTEERKHLMPAIAAIYASRLSIAVSRDGPITVFERRAEISTSLKGKLRTTDWLLRSMHTPHLFPILSNKLSRHNDYSRALALVARILMRHSASVHTRNQLQWSERILADGDQRSTALASGIALRRLPQQWSSYQSAWDIATSVLTRVAPFGVNGLNRGTSVVVEVWPLLETLLTRSLLAAAEYARSAHGIEIASVNKPISKRFLDAAGDSLVDPRDVEPDGAISVENEVKVVFDAKYKRRTATNWPSREDIFQVYATAGAYDATTAVLVYPEEFEPVFWVTTSENGRRLRVVAIGLNLFEYNSVEGDFERGKAIIELLLGLDAFSRAPQ